MSSKATPATTIDRAELVKALDELFTDPKNGYEIPDDAIVGKFSAKFEQLKAQVKTLTDEVIKLKGGTPAPAPAKGRVNPVK